MSTLTYAFLFAAVDMVPSVLMWCISPTDSVRVWYPTFLSYAGEHFVVSAAMVSLVWLVLRAAHLRMTGSEHGDRAGLSPTPIGMLLLGLVCVAVDVCASVALAWVQSADGGFIRLWDTERLRDYLSVREPAYAVILVVLAIGITIRQRARTRHVTPSQM